MENAIYIAFINYKGNSSKIKPTTITSNTRQEITTPKEEETKETSKIKFKIQILASDRVLPQNSKQFKGLKPVSCYKENGLIKYTYAENEDYNKILKIKRKIVDPKFKDAFIIAFKNDTKININKAIKEFKNNNK